VMPSPTLNMPRERLSPLWTLSMLSSVKAVPSMVSVVKSSPYIHPYQTLTHTILSFTLVYPHFTSLSLVCI
jgi:hypothetical protein